MKSIGNQILEHNAYVNKGLKSREVAVVTWNYGKPTYFKCLSPCYHPDTN